MLFQTAEKPDANAETSIPVIIVLDVSPLKKSTPDRADNAKAIALCQNVFKALISVSLVFSLI